MAILTIKTDEIKYLDQKHKRESLQKTWLIEMASGSAGAPKTASSLNPDFRRKE
jgi:hypothetical protein